MMLSSLVLPIWPPSQTLSEDEKNQITTDAMREGNLAAQWQYAALILDHAVDVQAYQDSEVFGLTLLEQVARKSGVTDAMYLLGYFYSGTRVSEHIYDEEFREKAFYWLRKAAKLGYRDAFYPLAQQFEAEAKFADPETNLKNAVHNYNAGVGKGCSRCAVSLLRYYAQGKEPISPDLKRARELFEFALKNGPEETLLTVTEDLAKEGHGDFRLVDCHRILAAQARMGNSSAAIRVVLAYHLYRQVEVPDNVFELLLAKLREKTEARIDSADEVKLLIALEICRADGVGGVPQAPDALKGSFVHDLIHRLAR